MSGLLLYSTNVFLKLLIQQKYQGDLHYVWCSEDFDCAKLHPYTYGSLVPPSSDPSSIYRELQRDVQRKDSHSAKINAQKATLIRLATDWCTNGVITPADKDDIIFMVNNAAFDYWRPLLYVIPRVGIGSRLQTVPITNRAGFGNEYIISDLRRSEFDILEF